MKDKKLEFLKKEFKKVKKDYKNFDQFYSIKVTDVLSCYNCRTYYWLSEEKKCTCE